MIQKHERPDGAIKGHLRKLFEIRKTKGIKAYREAYRYLCKNDLWFLMRVPLDLWFLDEDFHGKKLLHFWADNQEKDIITLVARGHVKTLTSVARIVQGFLCNPTMSVMVVSATETLSQGINKAVGNTLLYNQHLQWAFGDILPATKSQLKNWSKHGFTLPAREQVGGLEPSLMVASLKKEITGLHPMLIYLDDITGSSNNTPEMHNQTAAFIDQAKALLHPDGVLRWSATPWSDWAPVMRAIKGNIIGKQGRFEYLKQSCFIADDPSREPVFPHKERFGADPDTQQGSIPKWVSRGVSGFKHEQLYRDMTQPSKAARMNFAAQYRVDPAPVEEQLIRVSDIQIYTDEDMPPLSGVLRVGVETVGGGKPMLAAIKEKLQELDFLMPLEEITFKREAGSEKVDKIIAALEPLSSAGKLYCRRWMVPEQLDDESTLGHEIARLGAAKHDDIVDALAKVPTLIADGIQPMKGDPAIVFISCDLAWSEKKVSDWTVYLAAAIDSDGNLWVLDYDRFQSNSPTVLASRLMSFYRKWDNIGRSSLRGSNKQFSFAKSYN